MIRAKPDLCDTSCDHATKVHVPEIPLVAYHGFMTDSPVAVKIGPSNRVVLPAAIRAALGVQEGDRIEFVVRGLDVHVTTGRLRMEAVWAQNHGGDMGDSTADIRQERCDDLDRQAAKDERIAALIAADERSEEQIAQELLSSLGLD